MGRDACSPARAPRARTDGRGLFVPVGSGAIALCVLALGVPLHVNAVALAFAVAALGLVLVRMALALGENHTPLAASRIEATTDPLTELSNRRRLEIDLAEVLQADHPHALLLRDLNGFETYNDSDGHGAGDILLHRLGAAPAHAVDGRGHAGSELEVLRHAAALHDIGKLAIPESILEKEGALSEPEWALIRRHTIIDERILSAAAARQGSARLVRSGHERIDGTGYPDGLAAADIPLGSRIILVADAFDAMLSKRNYGATRSETGALAELRRCAGAQFDARVIAAFERVIARQAVPARL